MRSISNWFLKSIEKHKKKYMCVCFKYILFWSASKIKRLVANEINDHYIARNMKEKFLEKVDPLYNKPLLYFLRINLWWRNWIGELLDFFFFNIYLAVPGLHCSTGNFLPPWWHTGSLVAACGIFIPWPEIKPGPPALGAWSLSHWTTSQVSPELLEF